MKKNNSSQPNSPLLKKERRKFTNTGFLLIITIALFFLMYIVGMIVYKDVGFAKPQNLMNLFINNAGLIVIGCGLTMVMITGGIDISVGSVTALVCMVRAYLMEIKCVSAPLAVLAGLAVGFFKNREELLEKLKNGSEFSPQMEADKRENLLSGWQRAVNACKTF